MNSDVPKMPVFLKFSAFVHFLPLKSHLHALEVPQYLVSEKVVPKKTFDQSQQLKKKPKKQTLLERTNKHFGPSCVVRALMWLKMCIRFFLLGTLGLGWTCFTKSLLTT